MILSDTSALVPALAVAVTGAALAGLSVAAVAFQDACIAAERRGRGGEPKGQLDHYFVGVRRVRCFQLVFPHDGNKYAVRSRSSVEAVRLIADVLAVKEALGQGRPLEELCLHTGRRLASSSLDAAARKRLGRAPFNDLVQQLQQCSNKELNFQGSAGARLLHAAACLHFEDVMLLLRLLGCSTCAAAPCLRRSGAADAALAALSAANDNHQLDELYADFVMARLPLSEAAWAIVPLRCPGLGRALPAALAHSPQQAQQLVRRLSLVHKQRLRTFALCLARMQRQLDVPLPPLVLGQILALFDA